MNLWDMILGALENWSTKQHLQDLGATPKEAEAGITIHKDLSSFYSVKNDRDGSVMRLLQAQKEAIAMFQADVDPNGGWITKCNFGLQHVSNALGCHDFDGLMASQIVQRVSALCLDPHTCWREDSWERATDHAMKGGLAFLGWEAVHPEIHGHVASVAPYVQAAGHWGMVPMLANIGKPPNDFKKASACFLDSQRPSIRCFLWKAGEI